MSAQIKSILTPAPMTAASFRADPFLVSLVSVIKEGLVRDQHVRLHQFGTFRLKWSKPSTRRHPTTGEIMHLPPQPRVYFTPAKYLRELIEPTPAPAKPVVMASVTPIAASAAPASLVNTHREEAIPAKPVDQAMAAGQPPQKNPMGVAMGIGLLASIPLILSLLNSQFASDPDLVGKAANTTQTPVATTTEMSAEKAKPASTVSASIPTQTAHIRQSVAPAEKQIPVSQQAAVTGSKTTEVKLPAADKQLTLNTSPAPARVFMNPRIHSVGKGDNLWTLAKQYFGDPHLWPYIYRANRSTLSNPNYLSTGRSLVIPGLRNPATQLHESDSKLVAEGYLMLYRYYHNRASDNAYKYLIGARRFDKGILQREAQSILVADLAKAR